MIYFLRLLILPSMLTAALLIGPVDYRYHFSKLGSNKWKVIFSQGVDCDR